MPTHRARRPRHRPGRAASPPRRDQIVPLRRYGCSHVPAPIAGAVAGTPGGLAHLDLRTEPCQAVGMSAPVAAKVDRALPASDQRRKQRQFGFERTSQPAEQEVDRHLSGGQNCPAQHCLQRPNGHLIVLSWGKCGKDRGDAFARDRHEELTHIDRPPFTVESLDLQWVGQPSPRGALCSPIKGRYFAPVV